MDGTEGAKLTAHQAACLERLRACEASGMSLSSYAAEHGLDVRSLYDARKVLKAKGVLSRRSHAVRFQRAEIAFHGPESQWRIELPNGIVVEFSGAVDGGSLSTVLSAAAGLG
jgi:hypothetical protein